MSAKPFYAVIDFEATCWDEERRSDQEIIEWGCVRCDAITGKPGETFASFVRPSRYPELSQYCTLLTGITQSQVSNAPTFPWSLEMAIDFLGDPHDYLFCSWGEFDRYILRAACRFHRVPYPFDDHYLDLKPLFQDRVAGRSVDMRRALDMFGIAHHGKLHRAGDDAFNVALLLEGMIAEGIVPRP